MNENEDHCSCEVVGFHAYCPKHSAKGLYELFKDMRSKGLLDDDHLL